MGEKRSKFDGREIRGDENAVNSLGWVEYLGVWETTTKQRFKLR